MKRWVVADSRVAASSLLRTALLAGAELRNDLDGYHAGWQRLATEQADLIDRAPQPSAAARTSGTCSRTSCSCSAGIEGGTPVYAHAAVLFPCSGSSTCIMNAVLLLGCQFRQPGCCSCRCAAVMLLAPAAGGDRTTPRP